ncbi:DUF3226 domain-containing protein [Leucothrix pacifica]|uniref:DUF4435 domain-containing protein n=1 Tax=Leucothrix pacifica TaxID=1247513 RepID=A0A317CER5_9GAMM|nr:DUF3226 domain-containing protein [Leucothrix pacifica]PWQ96887.1 hypothetical protein DKW60_11815 [Leucothrix pacifica]
MPKLLEISKPFIVLVEGKDDAEMLYSLTHSMGMPKDEFQVLQYGGKQKFPSFLKQITNFPEFEMVTKLAIFRDADENSQSAFQSIEHHLKSSDLIPQDSVPTHSGEVKKSDSGFAVGIYITPDCSNKGALETLLLDSLTSEMKSEIETYVTQAEKSLSTDRARDKYKNSTKSRTYAYSALFENASFHDTFNKRLWDWSHPTFNQLKTFLQAF